MLRDPYGDRFDMDDDPFAEPREPDTCARCPECDHCDIEGHTEIGWCLKDGYFVKLDQEVCEWITEGRTWA